MNETYLKLTPPDQSLIHSVQQQPNCKDTIALLFLVTEIVLLLNIGGWYMSTEGQKDRWTRADP